MGEIFFRRGVVFFALVCSFVVFSVHVFAAVHPLYSGFSSANSGFAFNNASGLISVSDTAVYRLGYYSINGSTWQSFTLSGTTYNGDVNWLNGSSSYTLPVFGVGEHYVIVYSCTYSAGNSSWDCHDNKWQLIVINNSVSSCGNNCSSLNYQCGNHTICGNSVNCGSCSTGYNCTNGVCVVSQTVTCNGVTCEADEYCFNNVCLLNVSGNTYFVSTNGNDSWPGNFTHPWQTWEHAFTSAIVQPGDAVYFRGGVYYSTELDYVGIMPTRSGTENNWINYINYPGETPILDGINKNPSSTGVKNVGIRIWDVSYVKFKGLTVRNIKQYYNTTGNIGACWYIGMGYVILENCVAYNCGGEGIISSHNGADSTHYIINSDVYNVYDELTGGRVGNGFGAQNNVNTLGKTYFYGCRVWNSSDQGFNLASDGYVEVGNSWSFSNKETKSTGGGGGGLGFKMGWVDNTSDKLRHRVYNSISACNDGSGFLTNEWYGEDIPRTEFYNNFAYHNGNGLIEGFGIGISRLQTGNTDHELWRVFKNSIAYNNDWGEVYLRGGDSTLYTHDHNSWDSSVNVTDDDFVSLDCSQLMQPRKADGSLPDITFGHLKTGSDLIDSGVFIPQHHCATPGANPGEDCVEWYGSAPDMGPFETK